MFTLNGTQIIEITSVGTQSSASIELKSNTFSHGFIKWYDTNAAAFLKLYWENSSLPKEIIPSDYFYGPQSWRDRSIRVE